MVDVNSGHTLRAYRPKDSKNLAIESFAKIPIITAAPEGMPIELFPVDKKLDLEYADDPESNRRLSIRAVGDGEYEFHEMIVSERRVEKLKVTQRWVAGEKWWREYERYVDGKKELTAKWLNPPPLPSQVAARKTAEESWKKFAANEPLGMNMKLRAKVTVVAKHPRLADVLEQLRAATNVTLDLAENLRYHEPDLGDLQLPNVAAYEVCVVVPSADHE